LQRTTQGHTVNENVKRDNYGIRKFLLIPHPKHLTHPYNQLPVLQSLTEILRKTLYQTLLVTSRNFLYLWYKLTEVTVRRWTETKLNRMPKTYTR